MTDHALGGEQVEHSHDNWLMKDDTTLASEIRALIDRLCVENGFCLCAQTREELINAPPEDVDAFTDAMFAAEELDASLNKQLRRAVRDKIGRQYRSSAPNRQVGVRCTASMAQVCSASGYSALVAGPGDGSLSPPLPGGVRPSRRRP